jgi:hypothetical protein
MLPLGLFVCCVGKPGYNNFMKPRPLLPQTAIIQFRVGNRYLTENGKLLLAWIKMGFVNSNGGAGKH